MSFLNTGVNNKWASSHSPFDLLDNCFNSTNEIQNEECYIIKGMRKTAVKGRYLR